MSSKPTPYLYFLFGVLCGLILGTSLEREWPAVFTKLVFLSSVLILAISWRRLEADAHKRHVESWLQLRSKGKWFFIITRYVLLRGSVLLIVFIGPIYSTIASTRSATVVFIFLAVLLAFILSYLGHEEWTRCEQELEIDILKRAAEQSRISSAAKN